MFEQQYQKMSEAPGFVAALDQSGGICDARGGFSQDGDHTGRTLGGAMDVFRSLDKDGVLPYTQ